MPRYKQCFVLWKLLSIITFISIVRATGNERYVWFPDGATLQVAFCTSFKTYTKVPTIFTEGFNWGIAYDLPNQNSTQKMPLLVQRRKKRGIFYQELESILNSAHWPGKDCVYRVICEAGQKFRGRNMIQKILADIFHFPQDIESQEFTEATDDTNLYDMAYQLGAQNLENSDICQQVYSTKCPISLFENLTLLK